MNGNAFAILTSIQNNLEQLEKLVPDEINAESVSRIESNSMKAKILSGVLSCRIYELSLAALELLQNYKYLPAIIMIRAIMETTAMHYWLRKKVLYVVNHNELGSIETFLMRMLFGSRLNPGLQKSYNILDGLDKIDKETPGFRNTYDILCEYTHPNSAGTYFSYARRDDLNNKFIFKISSEQEQMDIGLNALTSCLEITLFSIKHINDLYDKFAIICDTTEPYTHKE